MRRSRVRSPSTPPASRRRRGRRAPGRARAPRDRAAGLSAELQAVSDELEAFSYAVSHDLRAPLRHIDGFLRLLQEELGAANPKAQHYLTTAVGAARRMGGLIEDLLAYSRAARQPLKPQEFDLGDLVREIVARLEPGAARPQVQWVIGELPRVSADRALLRIVLEHLLGNARKFTRDQPKPRIEVRARAGRGRAVEISIGDNGTGFDPGSVGRLFGVFQRLHREEEFEGNGIGLAIAQRILHRHGQRIRGQGTPGKGAVFTFTLAAAGS